jgi:hypothetical protein
MNLLNKKGHPYLKTSKDTLPQQVFYAKFYLNIPQCTQRHFS